MAADDRNVGTTPRLQRLTLHKSRLEQVNYMRKMHEPSSINTGQMLLLAVMPDGQVFDIPVVMVYLC
jgi:hypothetical protein